MMLNFDENVINIAKQANNVEELLALAEENNIKLTVEQAREYFVQLNPECKELAEDELSKVSGGLAMRIPVKLLPDETSTSSST